MLKTLKQLLGLLEDTDKDQLLNTILSLSTARLQTLLGGIEPPEELEHIIIETSVKRYNRIGSEGLASHTVEGESMAFSDSDFEEFAAEIQAFLDSQEDGSRGKVRFL